MAPLSPALPGPTPIGARTNGEKPAHSGPLTEELETKHDVVLCAHDRGKLARVKAALWILLTTALS